MSNPLPRLSFATTLLLLSVTACIPGGASSSDNASVAASAETSTGGSSVAVSAACSDAMAAAAASNNVSDTVADLEPAIRACKTLAEWIAASDANPAALDGASPELFVQNACASLEALANEPLCRAVGPPGS